MDHETIKSDDMVGSCLFDVSIAIEAGTKIFLLPIYYKSKEAGEITVEIKYEERSSA
jgi:hypothetical protein